MSTDVRDEFVRVAGYRLNDRPVPATTLGALTISLWVHRDRIEPQQLRAMTTLLENGWPGTPAELWDTAAAVLD